MESTTAVQLPKVAIRFCVQCKWNLRAAYYAQELLQTFSNTVGEISLIPVTGGIFTITLYTKAATSEEVQYSVTETQIWDRKQDGGFPETKDLKNRIRNVIDPEKDMGHVDRALKKGKMTIAGANGDKNPTAQQGQSEGSRTSADDFSKHTDHTKHKAQQAVPQDCEECREVVNEENLKKTS
ncbi:hypothetical protein LTR70_006776 [Exophiala xenobiotica]|uniref:Rdx family-domain-containing protein n=1 Tax=Lithohypha guttulata TaxID=1690604 RepID=A0ABR0K665_9EURO|nr:hypothetical protein LTR24_006367 [Lithohypha guttulata]KAK5315345.1 hypothetical protein LTR70_006776 [Exophiala xenobiotica]